MLNKNCGAEFVQKKHQWPANFDQSEKFGVTVDGDADWIVFFYKDQKIKVIDGDHLIALKSIVVKRIFEELGQD